MAVELANTASAPAFLQMMVEVHETPPSRRLAVAGRVASLKTLAEQGIPTPSTFRVTTRTFEDPQTLVAHDADHLPIVSFDGTTGMIEFNGVKVTVEEKTPQNPNLVSPELVRAVIQEGVEEIARFVCIEGFRDLLDELSALPADEQAGFVQEVVLNPVERKRRAIEVPAGLLIQRSQFADGRPTLFCVSKYVPLAYPWHKVTITVDSYWTESAVL
jgi:hypothetical protein